MDKSDVTRPFTKCGCTGDIQYQVNVKFVKFNLELKNKSVS